MKRMFGRAVVFSMAAAAVAAAFRSSADTLTWTGQGGNAKWSNAGNWSSTGSHASPQNGDSVVINIGETPLTVENDIDDLSLALFTALGKNDVDLTIDGKTIGLDGTSGVENTIWTNHCSIVLNAGVSLAAGKKGCMFFSGYSTIVHGDISAGSGGELKFRGRPNSAGKIKINQVEYDNPFDLVNDDPIIRFYGDIGGDGCTIYLSMGMNSHGTTGYFYGNVNCANLHIGTDVCPFQPHFMKPGNRVGAIRCMSSRSFVDVSEAFTEDTVVNHDSTAYVWPNGSGVFFAAGSHQTFNRLAGALNHSNQQHQYLCAGEYKSYSHYTNPTENSCTLELKGAEDSVGYAILCDAIDVVWNPKGDYTQDFRDRRHVTSGAITVKGGTVRSSGTNSFERLTRVDVRTGATFEVASTNATTFPELSLMTLGANAKFRVTEAEADPFSARTTYLSLADGAKIEVVDGGRVNVGRLVVNGVEIVPGTYMAEDWQSGGGTVVVAGAISTAKHHWIAAGGGSWSEAANWHDGAVPGASDTAILGSLGGEYTVSFDGASDSLPATTIIGGDGDGTASLQLSGETVLKTQNVYVRGGGRLLVPDGATLVNTNTAVVTAYTGGVVRVSGTGSIVSWENGYSNVHPVLNKGGSLQFQDSAKISSGGRPKSTRHVFTDGETVLSGSSSVFNDGTAKAHDYVSVLSRPNGSEDEAVLKFIDSAGLVNESGVNNAYFDNVSIGVSESACFGKGRVEFLSDCKHGQVFGGYVGSPQGEGTMLVGAGYVYFGGRGIKFGSSSGNRYSTPIYSGGTGRLVVTGGVLYVTSGGNVNEAALTGLCFGEGAIVASSIAENYTPWYGSFFQSGGVVTNASGCFCLGGERGSADFLMTGGEFRHTHDSSPFMVGIRGGRGTATFGGGEATIAGDVYAGGVFTNAIPNSDGTEWPINRLGWTNLVHYGTGSIVMTNGVVEFKKDLNLGWDGTGVVERVGSLGTFSVAGNMVLSNTAEYASASILRFTLDEEGIEPITVGGTLTVTPGSRIEVDVSRYAGKKGRHALLTAGAVDGSFADGDVEITGVKSGRTVTEARILTQDGGIYLSLSKGLFIIFR